MAVMTPAVRVRVLDLTADLLPRQVAECVAFDPLWGLPQRTRLPARLGRDLAGCRDTGDGHCHSPGHARGAVEAALIRPDRRQSVHGVPPITGNNTFDTLQNTLAGIRATS
jgi:hypothetical protein